MTENFTDYWDNNKIDLIAVQLKSSFLQWTVIF